jgi:betaine-aldehyde dehydrogenase
MPNFQLPNSARQFGLYLDGSWQSTAGRQFSERRSPGHDVPVTRIVTGDHSDVDAAVRSARAAFEYGEWRQYTSEQRATVLIRAAALIRERSNELALLETLESGKAISQSLGEINGAAGIYEYAAGACRLLHGDTFNNLGESHLGLVTREPVGVVGLITPWNFPFFILAERVPFILASGCTLVAKPSELTSATTLLMAEIMTDAGLPKGVFNVVTGKGSVIGQALIEHPGIDMLSFTGSTEIGQRVVAASTVNFKRLGLELGGKNPQLVFADANLDDAADGIAYGICFNAGQCCVSGSRLISDKRISKDIETRVAEKLKTVRIGDPLDESMQVGAIVSEEQERKIVTFVENAVKSGANLICGGKRISKGKGRYLEPALFASVDMQSEIAREEIFGPVLVSTSFDTFDEALRIANDSPFGLAASIWSKNLDIAIQAARKVQAGRVWVNTTITGGPEMPIGGVKQSGWGRETGIYGVEEYTNVKSTLLAFGDRTLWTRS